MSNVNMIYTFHFVLFYCVIIHLAPTDCQNHTTPSFHHQKSSSSYLNRGAARILYGSSALRETTKLPDFKTQLNKIRLKNDFTTQTNFAIANNSDERPPVSGPLDVGSALYQIRSIVRQNAERAEVKKNNSPGTDGLGTGYLPYARSHDDDKEGSGDLSSIGYSPLCGDACARGEFLCVQSCTCIKLDMRCNGEIDCDKAEDELKCGETELTEQCDETQNQVRCPKTGKCISKDWLCDGDDDCGDFTDETRCGFARNCSEDQFECSNGLCIQKSWVCDNDNDCKDFSDEFNCTYLECQSHEFPCDDGSCISLSWKCDQEVDCRDGSDERDCDAIDIPYCDKDEFQCASASTQRRCIRKSFLCDGDNDCDDWSDEVGCEEQRGPCTAGEFTCNNGRCIPEMWRCDKTQDCVNGEDEMHCDNVTQRICSSDEFTCKNGNCILKTWVCDGSPDCTQGEDEESCRIVCNENQFTCESHVKNDSQLDIPPFCVNVKHRCDGQKDCPRGEDEVNCPVKLTCPKDTKCSQNCITFPDGTSGCSCMTGFRLAKDGFSCEDIDECLFQTNAVCSQRCNNTIGSFICGCVTGYVLRPDLRTCKALGSSPTLIFANRVDIRQVSLSNSKYISIVKGLHNSIAVDYHYEKGSIYWSDISKDVIQTAFINGTGSADLIKWGLESPSGIAIDWIHNLIFWTDSGTKRIEVASLDGRHRSVVVSNDVDKPRAIVVHPGEAFVFWSDWGPNPKIERVYMDGSKRREIVKESIFWPNGLTLDYTQNRIYWVDAKHHVIESALFDGSNRKKVLSRGLTHPFALTLFEDSIFWTDWHSKSVLSSNKVTGAGIRIIHSGLHFPMDIHSYHPQRQPKFPNRCGKNNGGCSSLCLPNEKSYRCVCPFSQGSANRECRVPDKMVILARKKEIRIKLLQGNRPLNNSAVDMIIPLDETKSISALEFDSKRDVIFWADTETNIIYQAHLNGSYQKAIVSHNLRTCEGLAVDWLTEKIYWSDSSQNRIDVANYDGTMRAVIVWEDLDKPKSIAVVPNDGIMFWVQWSTNSRIEKAAMDGSFRQTIIGENLFKPNGLVVDRRKKLMYWTDSNAIEFAQFDGTNRGKLVDKKTEYPLALDLFDDTIFWVDMDTSIHSANQNNGNNHQVTSIHAKELRNLKIFHRKREMHAVPCDDHNGRCSHLCLLRLNGYSCACPVGLKLIDNFNCQQMPDNFLLFSHRIDLRQISLDVSYALDSVLPMPPMKNAIAVDFDPKTNDIYWSDSVESIIMRSSWNGTIHKPLIYNQISTPDGLAIDAIGRKIYWTDAKRKSIEVAELNGQNRKLLISADLDSPRAIVLYYRLGYMFWTDWGAVPKIERAAMDGSKLKSIIRDKIRWPNGLAIDDATELLYWTDASEKVIESCDFNGGNRRVIVSIAEHPYGVTVVNDDIYWTDWQTESINRANKINGANRTSFNNKLVGLMDIKLVRKTEKLDENVCGSNNGGCSHLCLRNDMTYSCSCPTGLNFKSGSQRDCEVVPSNSLLLAARSSLLRISLDVEKMTDVTLHVPNLNNAITLDFHWAKKLVFVADVELHVVKSVSLYDLMDTNTILWNLTAPEGLAVDWIADNIYLCDTERKVIEVARLDGTSRKVLISTNLDEPRSIAVHPKKGLLFWSDWSDHSPKIERSFLDGSSRKVIINRNIDFPNGLTIDYKKKRLYWVDALRERIELSDLNGKRRGFLIVNATHPYSLTIFQDYVYWTDFNDKAILRANKTTGKNITKICSNVDSVIDIKAISASRQTGWNPCAVNNGGCTHLCFFNRHNYSCECPDLIDASCRTSPKQRVSLVNTESPPEDEEEDELDEINDNIKTNDVHDSDYIDHLYVPAVDTVFTDETSTMEEAHSTIRTYVILFHVLLVVLVLLGLFIYFNFKNVKTFFLYSNGNLRAFSNPNYANGGGGTPTELETRKRVRGKSNSFLWRTIKYDKGRDQVYEEKASTTEINTLISEIFPPRDSIVSESENITGPGKDATTERERNTIILDNIRY